MVASRSFFRALACASSGLVLAIAVALPWHDATEAAAALTAHADHEWLQTEATGFDVQLRQQLLRLQLQLLQADMARMSREPFPRPGDFPPPPAHHARLD